MKKTQKLPWILGLVVVAILGIGAVTEYLAPQVCSNMAALRALTPNESKPAFVLGYYRPLDGGHGWYAVTNTTSGTNANGGRILALGGTKSWELLPEGRVNILQFGASKTGTNNEPFIEAAMEYAAPLGLPTFVPSGMYTNTASLDAPDNTVLSGEGETSGLVRNFLGGDRNATLRNKGIPIMYLMSYPWTHVTTNLTFEHLAFYTANSNVAGAHISLGYANQVRLHDLTFYKTYTNWATALCADNMVGSKLRFRENTEIYEDGLHILGGGNIMFTDLDIDSGDDSIAVSTEHMDIPLTNVVIANARVFSNKGHGIRIYRIATNAVYPIENVQFKNITGIAGQTKNGAISIQGCSVATATGGVFGAKNITLDGVDIQPGSPTKTGGTNHTQAAIFHYVENLVLKNVRIPWSYWHGYSITYCHNVSMIDCLGGSPELTTYATVYALNTDTLTFRGGTYGNTNIGFDTIRADNVGALSVYQTLFDGISTNCNAIRVRPGVDGTNDVFAADCKVVNATGGRFILVDNNNIRTLSVRGNQLDTGLATAVLLSGVTATTYEAVFNTGEAFTQQQGPLKVVGTGSTTPLFTIERSGVGSMEWKVAGATFQFGGYNGQMAIGTSFTDATAKLGRYGALHYTITEEPVGGMSISSGASSSVLRLGGGDNTLNAATLIEGYVATNTTTTTGTKAIALEIPATSRGTSLSILDASGTFRRVASTNVTVDGVSREILVFE